MHTFFHGWRRKTGVVALVMACVLAGTWLRTLAVCDYLTLRTNPQSCIGLHLLGGCAELRYEWLDKSESAKVTICDRLFIWNQDDPVGWSMRFLPMFRWSSLRRIGWFTPATECISVTLPLLTTTISLTLLSAYLILWKPRERA